MSSNLNSYTHPDFGNLRTIVDGENIYICAKDAATALGYANTNKAIKDHCKGVTKRYPLETPGGTQEFAFGTAEGLVDLRVYAASVAVGFMMSSNSTGVSFPSWR
ncbi:hypothetical protein CYJ26_05810 [Actinomyces urogenitalis]|uniref:Bro-N domain-containing protein n=5 Tax=Actinomyces urogenitalis TaxID=103621 RepID=A0A2I1KTD8_9ACTO|nr:Bro-N domain-containing protein [Actinomyces urogenitalis]PKY98895.1 hypothetical protein CYJ26_05810 [Actinomyces urogenitalis]